MTRRLAGLADDRATCCRIDRSIARRCRGFGGGGGEKGCMSAAK